MFRRIGRAFKEAFQGLFRHFAMASSSAVSITITLVLVSCLTMVVANVSQIASNIEGDVQIYVTIDNDVQESDIQSLVNTVSKIDGVSEVTYSSADEELNALIEYYGDDGSIFEIYRDDNPLSRALYVKIAEGYTLTEVGSKIERVNGITSIDFGGTTTEQFIELLKDVQKVGYTIVIALAVLAVFLIQNTIKITIDSRREEIAIMRFVGATNSYIRTPLVLEGIFIGIIGSIIPVALTYFGYNWVYNYLGGQLISGLLTLLPVYPFVFMVSGFLVLMGISVGFIGSYLSATHNLRWKR